MTITSDPITDLITGMDNRRAKAKAIAESASPDVLVHDAGSDWTAKDLITHLTMFEEDAVDCIEAFLRGDAYQLDLRGTTDFNDFNEIRRNERIDRTWEAALQEWHNARERLKAVVSTFPHDKLDAMFATPFLQELSLMHCVKSCGVHEKEHIGQIKAAIDS